MLDLVSDAEKILKFLNSGADNVAKTLVAATLLLAFIIGVKAYKNKLVEYIFHPRNAWKFILLLVIFALVVYLRWKGFINGYLLIILSGLSIALFFAVFSGMRTRSFSRFRNPIVRKYEKELYKGYAIENQPFIDQNKHWYLCMAEDKVEYQMLRCMYYVELNELHSAYNALKFIKEKWLYKDEKEIIEIEVAQLLLMMGSVNTAVEKLDYIESKREKSHPNIWFSYSFKYEQEGDIDKAFECMKKSRSIVEAGYKMSDWERGEIYNNYSRIAVITGNKSEALKYMQMAWKLVKDSKDMRLINLVAQNLILQSAMYGVDKNECDMLIEEYRGLISDRSYTNQIEFYNTLILYYRQIGEDKRVYEIIKETYKQLIEHLDKDRAALFTASTFRMLINGNYEKAWFDNYLKASRKTFNDLSIRVKLNVYHEYMSIFDQGNIRFLSDKRPYKGIKLEILRYYEKDAIKDIEEELHNTESIDVFRYKNLMQEKLFVLSHIEGKNHISNNKSLYLDLYDELYKNGLHLDAVNILMMLVEECKNPNNLIVWLPMSPVSIYYSDILNSIPPAPDPLHNSDGYHLDYFQLKPIPFAKITSAHIDIIQENIDIIIDEYHTWKNHPFKLSLCLGIANMLMCLNRHNEAKEYYEFYKNSGQSENQLSAWAREDYEMLAIEFGDKEAG